MLIWVVVGCGYTGERVAARLVAAGETVIATTRRPEHAAALRTRGVDARVLDAADGAALTAVVPADAVVVDSVPPDATRGASADEARAHALVAARPRRLIYLSSTGVYARGDGGWVDEDSPVAPDTRHGRARVAAERAVLAAAAAGGVSAVALRIAAIYGPGRGVAARLAAGTYRVIGDGASFTSRVHVEDLVTAILAAGYTLRLARPAYVVADDEPTTSRAYADAVAAHLGLPPPPSVPIDQVPPEAAELAVSNRRIRNARLKDELGVMLRVPSWREGLAAG